MVQITEYTKEQAVPFHHLYAQYWNEVELEKPIDYIPFEGPKGPDVTNQMQSKLYTYQGEGAKIRLAYHERELIGFLIYHMIFNCVMIVRAAYMKPEHRGKSVWSKMVRLGHPHLKRMYGQSYVNKEPGFFKFEKDPEKAPNNKILHEEDGMKIWGADVLEE